MFNGLINPKTKAATDLFLQQAPLTDRSYRVWRYGFGSAVPRHVTWPPRLVASLPGIAPGPRPAHATAFPAAHPGAPPIVNGSPFQSLPAPALPALQTMPDV